MMQLLMRLLPIAATAVVDAAARRPNIVLLLTDDLDLMLGGMDDVHQPHHIPALRRRGAEVSNWFCHTPVCCPSRSEILTGKFFHNLVLRAPGADRWNTNGHGHAQQCMYVNESRLSPGPTFAEHLGQPVAEGGGGGYVVGVFGKYLNLSPRSGTDVPQPWSPGPGNSNPVQAPAGVHTYFVNPGPVGRTRSDAVGSPIDPSGEYYPLWFLQGSPGFNGTFRNGACPANISTIKQPSDCPGMLYETDLLARHATQWLHNISAEKPGQPFFAYIAPHGPHGAAIPAPQHRAAFPNVTAPRGAASWNYSAQDHHWLVRTQPPVREGEVTKGDAHFRNRWRCMLSVDELVGAVVEALTELSVIDSTYIFFSSDHGFHFHNLRLGVGKWSVYDHDIRVPMLVSGPGIRPNSVLGGFVGSHADLAPTWLAMAGLPPASEMDGHSLLRNLINNPDDVTLPRSVQRRLQLDWESLVPAAPKVAYIEYHGLGFVPPNFISHKETPGIRLMDCLNNTYRALRFNNHAVHGDLLFAEFGSDFFFENSLAFVEVYNMSIDPWNTVNIAAQLSAEHAKALHTRLEGLWSCQGYAECAPFFA